VRGSRHKDTAAEHFRIAPAARAAQLHNCTFLAARMLSAALTLDLGRNERSA
jgi:hypothetical protein